MNTLVSLAKLPYIHTLNLKTLPHCTAIYFAIRSSGEILYIGKARDLYKRWQSHHRAAQLIAADIWLHWIVVAPATTDQGLAYLERWCIRRFAPRLNDTPLERQPVRDTRSFTQRYHQRWTLVEQQINGCRTTATRLVETERQIDRELLAAQRWLRVYQRRLGEVLARRQEQHAATRSALLALRQQCLQVLPSTRQAV